MGSRVVECFSATQKLSSQQPYSYSAKSEGTLATLCCRIKSHSERSPHSRKELNAKVIQQPMYYISEALSGAKLNYLKIEKIAYVILISSRKLKHYFQAHEIMIPSS